MRLRVATARLLVFAALGAALGTCAETVHRRADVWYLPSGGGLPWWIAGAYFIGLLIAGEGLRRFERRHPSALRLTTGRVLIELLLFVALFLAPPALHAHEGLLTVVAVGYLVARLVWFRAPGDVAVAAGAIGVDAAIEGALLAASLFRYRHAALTPMPLWLAPLWGGLGLGLRRIFARAVADPAALADSARGHRSRATVQ